MRSDGTSWNTKYLWLRLGSMFFVLWFFCLKFAQANSQKPNFVLEICQHSSYLESMAHLKPIVRACVVFHGVSFESRRLSSRTCFRQTERVKNTCKKHVHSPPPQPPPASRCPARREPTTTDSAPPCPPPRSSSIARAHAHTHRQFFLFFFQ